MAKKSAGMALYLEFRRENQTQLLTIVSESAIPDTSQVLDITILQRSLSEQHPQRPWEIISGVEEGFSSVSASNLKIVGGAIQADMSTQDSLDRYPKTMLRVNDILKAMYSSDWELYKTPLLVEVGPAEVKLLSERKHPEALTRRIVRAREAAGFDKEFISEKAGAN